MHSTKTGTTGLIAEDTVGVVVSVVGVVGVEGVTSLPATNTLRIFLSSPNEGSNKKHPSKQHYDHLQSVDWTGGHFLVTFLYHFLTLVGLHKCITLLTCMKMQLLYSCAHIFLLHGY